MYTDGFVVAQVGIGTVFLQKCVPTHQNISQPLQDLCVIDQLSLDQLLGYGEQDLGTKIDQNINKVN